MNNAEMLRKKGSLTNNDQMLHYESDDSAKSQTSTQQNTFQKFCKTINTKSDIKKSKKVCRRAIKLVKDIVVNFDYMSVVCDKA